MYPIPTIKDQQRFMCGIKSNTDKDHEIFLLREF
jgi:hypothetical protein